MKKRLLEASVFVLAITLMTGCHKEYSKLNRRFSTTQKTYSLKDTLHIRNYILYNTQDHLSLVFNNKPIPINEDSVMQVVLGSFEKLEIPLVSHLEKGKNHIDSAFYKDYLVRIRKIDENWIKEVAGDTHGCLTLIPFIYIFNRISFTGYITSGGMAGNNGFHVVSFVNLIVYLVEDDKIIYSNQIRYTTERTWADTRAEAEALPPAPSVNQEHWDELVRLAMEDYIKRLK